MWWGGAEVSPCTVAANGGQEEGGQVTPAPASAPAPAPAPDPAPALDSDHRWFLSSIYLY